MFRVLVFFEDNEKHINDMGEEYYHSGYVFKDVETEEEMEKLFEVCSKALIEKVNEHIESYGMVEVFKGSLDDFDCEHEVSMRTLRYTNSCSEQNEIYSLKNEIDIWDDFMTKSCRAKLEGINGMVSEIQLM